MKTRLLGNIEVSEIGMGCMAFSHGCGKIPPEEYSVEAIRNARRHGCTLFDTAEVYSAGTGLYSFPLPEEPCRPVFIAMALCRCFPEHFA